MNSILQIILLSFCQVIIFTHVVIADDNSSKSTQVNKNQSSVSEKSTHPGEGNAEPEIVFPERKTIRNTITLKGFIEDPDAVSISIDTQNWSDLRVSSPPVHGKTIKKDEIILKLDMEKIRNHIQVISHDLTMLDLNKEILQAEIKLAEELASLEKDEINRFEKYVKEDYNRYHEIYLPFDKRSAEMSLKRYEENLAYTAEELNQLKKMYQADDLTEETEEIILQRAQNQYEHAKFSLEAAKIRNEEFMNIQLPRGKTATDANFNRERLSIKTIKKIKPNQLNRKKLEGKKLVEERKQFAMTKAKIEKDLKIMETIKSPSNGMLFWGTFDRGKWTGGNSFKTKLRKGGVLKSHEDILTICPSKKIQARINLPEKDLHQVRIGNKTELKLTASDDLKIKSSIRSISKTPVDPGIFDLTADFVLPKGFTSPVPGSACSLECVTYYRENAITLPSSVIKSDDDRPESKFVYVLTKKGKQQRKNIEIGKKSGKSVEILSGIRMGMKVLKDKLAD